MRPIFISSKRSPAPVVLAIHSHIRVLFVSAVVCLKSILGGNMTINFPNRSRSYDATRRAVHFWGYDRSMESSFFIMADALKQMQPNLRFDAIDILRAFDANRERIYSIAAKVYARGRRGTYDLNVDDV
jgi:hypothetical protein